MYVSDASQLCRSRNLGRRLSQPGLKTGDAELRAPAWNQRGLAESGSRVTGIWISDNFAGVVKRGQTPPNQLIHAKLLRTSDFDDAVYWRTHGNPGHSRCNIFGGHGLEKHRRQMYLAVDHGNVGKPLKELEELRCVHDGVGN